ncbi:hypothetical protein ONZ45_g8294 [Pleurotus djamor]|nr:hypothetical protein ONZ45_g8294 [Pleurotus djamor]
MPNHQNDNATTPITDSLTPNTPEWLLAKVAPKLGYTTLRAWQIELSVKILNGEDVVCVAPVGAGKSSLLHIPLTAKKMEEGRVLGISIAPTKTLCEDQVDAATKRGLRALALHGDSIRAGNRDDPPRSLLDEVFADEWDLVIMPPEMLSHDSVTQLLKSQATLGRANTKQTPRIDLIFVDECHLVHEQGEGFRQAYKSIGGLRGRLPSEIPWVAVTGTLPPGDITNAVLKALGFPESEEAIHRERVDTPHIKYIPRILQHPISANTMYDIAWCIPRNISIPQDIQKTIILGERIEFIVRVVDFLNSLLPLDLPHRNTVIMPFYSLFSLKYRQLYIDAYKSGLTRILVGTDCLTYGLDVRDIKVAIILGLTSSPSQMTQQIGRIGRNGQEARAFTYAPKWVEEVIPETKQDELNAARREKLNPMLLRWHNPTPSNCPRHTACSYYGDEYRQVEHCCIVHDPEDDDLKGSEAWVKELEVDVAKEGAMRSDGTHHRLDKNMVISAKRMIDLWSRRAWQNIRGEDTVSSDVMFFPQRLRILLSKQMHLITSPDKVRKVLKGWKYVEAYANTLFKLCKPILEQFDEMTQERKKVATSKRDPKGKRKLEDSDDNIDDDNPDDDSVDHTEELLTIQGYVDSLEVHANKRRRIG